MVFLQNKIPPPLVTIGFASLMWVMAQYQSLPVAGYWHLVFAGLYFIAGLVIAILAIKQFKQVQTTVNPIKPEAASSLVTTGIYQYSRNPMYLGLLCLLLAWAMFLASPLCLLGVLGFVWFITRFQILPEEEAMGMLFGEAFIKYRRKVRRWI